MNTLLILGAVAAAWYFFIRKNGRMKVPSLPGTFTGTAQDETRPPGTILQPSEERISETPSGTELVNFVTEIGGRTVDTGLAIPTGASMAGIGQTIAAPDVGGLNQPVTVVQMGSGPVSQIPFVIWGTGFPFGSKIFVTEGTILETQGWYGAAKAVLRITAMGYDVMNRQLQD